MSDHPPPPVSGLVPSLSEYSSGFPRPTGKSPATLPVDTTLLEKRNSTANVKYYTVNKVGPLIRTFKTSCRTRSRTPAREEMKYLTRALRPNPWDFYSW